MKRHSARRPLAVAAAALAACTVCSCTAAASHGPASSTPSAPSAPASSRSPVSTPTAAAPVRSFSTPLAATISWFAAVNAKDQAAAVAHFVPADAFMMNWEGGTSAWSTFTRLHCKPLSAGATSATVLCTFDESVSLSGGSPDNFWTVSLARQQDGRWLINNYGTG